MNKSESKYFHTAELMDQAFLALLNTKELEYITVKEICEKAGVNRSTFYLHYETIADLLDESIAYMNRQFESYFSHESSLDVACIASADVEHLYLITPQYLIPYLQYVKDHRRLFKTVLQKSSVLRSEEKMNWLFREVVDPIMERYHIPREKRPYVFSFHINGIVSVLKMWVEHDCRESMDFILEMITECIKLPYIVASACDTE